MQGLADSLLSFYNHPFLEDMDWLEKCVRNSRNIAHTIRLNQDLMNLFFFFLNADISNCTFINFTTENLPRQEKDQFVGTYFTLTLQNREYYTPFEYLQSVIPWDKVNADKMIQLGCFEIKGLTKRMNNTYYDDDDPSAYKIWVKLKSQELHNFVDYIQCIQNKKISMNDHVMLFRLLLCTRDVVAEQIASYIRENETPFLKNDNQYVNQLHFAYSCPGSAKCFYDQREKLRKENSRRKNFVRQMEEDRMFSDDSMIT